ncbi:hypothetical protein P153DRAFT_369638 [Dothidotthia symphoricarpi CBS 119687]|uniref:Uncharacterized protein n=1 Tax=Dothidotthia symphoricarpi CBS 119687 TaxID=1392245 RepID=A0A6A6A553_9PLEO|nr:uncharacterized protein P153DRAFT_369638 [Dothidotthia symphoricarpi CBS 119687]KAF2126303.1 hypothetical protein P153DRAFT_369638 [Dothidotthia symphoricarpi CBS 119687]
MSTTTKDPQGVLQEAKDAMMEYYTLLCRMPHMKPECLRVPPAEGWSGTHADDLRKQGWSDQAAEISRHLPFLAPGLYDAEHAWITWSSTAVAFDQPVNDFYLSRTSTTDQPKPPYLPPHVIYIGQGYSEAKEYLLLDTELGKIVSYPNYGGDFAPPNLTFDEYEALAPERKWKAHPTLPLKAFFERASTRLKRLVYIPVPCRRRGPSFHFRAEWPAEEAALLAVEDEFDAEHEANDDYFDNENDDDYVDNENDDEQDEIDLEDLRLSGDEDGGEDEAEDEVSDDEMEWLRHDAEQAEYQPAPRLERPELKPLPEKTKKVYEAYKQNGWPHDHFNVEKCRVELTALQDEWDRVQKAEMEAKSKNKKEDYVKRLTPE